MLKNILLISLLSFSFCYAQVAGTVFVTKKDRDNVTNLQFRVNSLETGTNNLQSQISGLIDLNTLSRSIVTSTPTMSDGEPARIQYRFSTNSTPRPLVIYFHGAGEGQNEAFENADESRVTGELIDSGYIVASGRGKGGVQWGSPTAQESYMVLFSYLTNSYTVSSVYFIGQSAGALTSLNLIQKGLVDISGWYGIYPLISLSQAYTIWPEQIEAAYGFSGSENYAIGTSGNDPMLANGYLYWGLDYRMTASYSDTIVTRTANSDAFVAKVSPIGITANIVEHTGNHGDASAFKEKDVNEFFIRIVKKSRDLSLRVPGYLYVNGDINATSNINVSGELNFNSDGLIIRGIDESDGITGISYSYNGIEYILPLGSSIKYEGVTGGSGGIKVSYVASGTNWVAHIFTNSSVFAVSGVTTCDVIVVGGCGGGGLGAGGGGGGGGVVIASNLVVTTDVNVTVGRGGRGGQTMWSSGEDGTASSFGIFEGYGGSGGGGPYNEGGSAANGGSGGGGGGFNQTGGLSIQPSFALSISYGNEGGDATYLSASPSGGGGGGGAGGPGADGIEPQQGGDGGPGIACDFSGEIRYYGAGGGGAAEEAGPAGLGGSGVGGNGGLSGVSVGQDGSPVMLGTGGGGGSWVTPATGGGGSDGIVIVRYAVLDSPVDSAVIGPLLVGPRIDGLFSKFNSDGTNFFKIDVNNQTNKVYTTADNVLTNGQGSIVSLNSNLVVAGSITENGNRILTRISTNEVLALSSSLQDQIDVTQTNIHFIVDSATDTSIHISNYVGLVKANVYTNVWFLDLTSNVSGFTIGKYYVKDAATNFFLNNTDYQLSGGPSAYRIFAEIITYSPGVTAPEFYVWTPGGSVHLITTFDPSDPIYSTIKDVFVFGSAQKVGTFYFGGTVPKEKMIYTTDDNVLTNGQIGPVTLEGDVTILRNLDVSKTNSAMDFIINDDLGGGVDFYSVPSVYRSVIQSSTNVVITANQAVYKIDVDSASLISNDLSQLDFVNQAVEYTLIVNIREWAATGTTFAANFDIQNTENIFSSTGTYWFACSSLDGLKIILRRDYPNIYVDRGATNLFVGDVSVPYNTMTRELDATGLLPGLISSLTNSLGVVTQRIERTVGGGTVTNFFSRSGCGVLKTGVTVTQIVGDDGYWQSGVTFPNPLYEIQPGGLIVKDNLSGLYWTKNCNLISNTVWAAANGTADWKNAVSFATNLNAIAYGGRTDWRLPNRNEFFSLVNKFQWINPAVSDATGTNQWTEARGPWTNLRFDVVLGRYWTSTPYAGALSAYAWHADLAGFYSTATKVTFHLSLYCAGP